MRTFGLLLLVTKVSAIKHLITSIHIVYFRYYVNLTYVFMHYCLSTKCQNTVHVYGSRLLIKVLCLAQETS